MARTLYLEFPYSSYPSLCAKDPRAPMRSQQLSERSPLLALDKQLSRRYPPEFPAELQRVQDELAQLVYVHSYDRRSYCAHFHPLDPDDIARSPLKYRQMNREPCCARAHALVHRRVGRLPRYLHGIKVQMFSDQKEPDLRELHQYLGSL